MCFGLNALFLQPHPNPSRGGARKIKAKIDMKAVLNNKY